MEKKNQGIKQTFESKQSPLKFRAYYWHGQSLLLFFLLPFSLSNLLLPPPPPLPPPLLLFSVFSVSFFCFHCISTFPLRFLCLSLSRARSLSSGCISAPLWRNKSFWSSTRGEAPSALIHFILVTDAYNMAYYCLPECSVNFRELNMRQRLSPTQTCTRRKSLTVVIQNFFFHRDESKNVYENVFLLIQEIP